MLMGARKMLETSVDPVDESMGSGEGRDTFTLESRIILLNRSGTATAVAVKRS
jgi:hypothetical protein